MNGELLNHAGQWAAILIGGLGLWTTLRRMRTNEIAHLEAEMREEVSKLHARINDVRDGISELGERVSRIEGRLNDRGAR